MTSSADNIVWKYGSENQVQLTICNPVASDPKRKISLIDMKFTHSHKPLQKEARNLKTHEVREALAKVSSCYIAMHAMGTNIAQTLTDSLLPSNEVTQVVSNALVHQETCLQEMRQLQQILLVKLDLESDNSYNPTTKQILQAECAQLRQALGISTPLEATISTAAQLNQLNLRNVEIQTSALSTAAMLNQANCKNADLLSKFV